MGVRQIVPIHNTNNLFGGAAIFRDQYNVNNHKLTGDWFRVRQCTGGVQMRLLALTPEEQREIATIWPELAFSFPAYPQGAHCNVKGLTPLGRQMLQGMMHRKMIIDFDHLSQLSFADALALTQQHGGYPLVSSHTGLVSIAKAQKKTEFWKTDSQVVQISKSGGLMALLLAQGRRNEAGDSYEAKLKGIANDCGNSSKTWAQAYLRAVQLVDGGAVALATDFGGFVPGLAPRFGPNACDGQRDNIQRNLVTYPFTAHGTTVQLARAVTGERTFDYNFDGLAHVGLLPDFIQDLKRIGLTDQDLAPLFRSAEAYIRLWERIQRTNVADF
jgi:microsomal dipeptidase-like Zn-dependent dipeptidase